MPEAAMSANPRPPATEVLARHAERAEPGEQPSLGLRRLTTVGLAVLLLFFGAFGGWAALAPLDSATIAQGVIKVDGERKVIQHLEGGIVADLKVADGDFVDAGQVLLRLDDTQSRAHLDLLTSRRLTRQALAARLGAERDDAPEIEFPGELLAPEAAPVAGEAAAVQRDVFEARRRAIEGETAILRQRILQTEDEIDGLHAMIEAQTRLIAILDAEASDLEGLFEKGLTTRERYTELRRRQAELEGERATHVAGVARARKSIVEIEQQILQLSTRRLNDAVAELSEVEAEIFDLEQQIRAAEDVLRRIDVRAPVGGIVMDLQVHTTGGVIRPGEPIMHVVPVGERLVIEARVRPEDVDVLAAGQSAQVRISAFDRFDMLPLEGTVAMVSADRLVEERTGVSYFTAIIVVTDGELEKLEGRKLLPGMSAEAMIRTGTRTLIGYLSEPLSRNLRRAMRES
jgi:HlyD family type I secretion membrane fusion protein